MLEEALATQQARLEREAYLLADTPGLGEALTRAPGDDSDELGVSTALSNRFDYVAVAGPSGVHGDRSPEPYAIYGYEAMSLVLDAIERAGERGDECEAVLEQLDRRSVLGTYSIDERGDTTLTDYGVYRITEGQLEFSSVIRGERSTAP